MGKETLKQDNLNNLFANCLQIKKQLQLLHHNCLIIKWAHSGLNQGPPDYESGALTN